MPTLPAASRLSAGSALLIALAAGVAARAQPPAPAAAAPAVEAEPAAVRPTSIGGEPFFSESTVAELMSTRVVPFRLAAPAEKDTNVAFTSSDTGVISIIDQGQVLAGEAIGFVRIRATKLGSAKLSFARGSISIDVIPARSEIRELLGTPEIISPAGGAFTWGGFSVAVQWMNPPRESFETCTLRLTDGRELRPTEEHGSQEGPNRIASFSIPRQEKPGIIEMTPVVTDRAGNRRIGRPIAVRIIDPDRSDVMVFEAEEWANAPRPDRWRRGKAPIVKDDKTSGGAYVNHGSADPAVSINFEVPKEFENDYWQMVVVAAGDIGGEALPSIGFYLDERNQPITQASIAATAWHRVPIGVPVQLGAGRALITPHYDNDFASGKSDRNLRLDRIEMYRIPSGSSSIRGTTARAAAGSSSDSMMGSGDAMAAAPAMASAGASPMMGGGDAMMGGQTATASRSVTNPSYFFQPIDHDGLDSRDTRLGWRTVVDGLSTPGLLEVTGRISQPGGDNALVPVVSLIVNGTTVSTQHSVSPRFWVMPAWLTAKTSTLEMKAVWSDGRSATAPVQRITSLAAAETPASIAGGIYKRWTLHDPAWSGAVRSAVKPKSDLRETRQAIMTGEAPVFVSVDESLKGRIRVQLEGRAVGPKQPTEVTALLRTASGDTPIGTIKVGSYDGTFDFGPIDLPGGEQSIVLTTPVVKNKEGNAESRFRLDALLAIGEPPANADTNPQAEIARVPSEPVYLADAVVVRPWNARGIRRIDLLLNGSPTGISIDTWGEPGPFVLPLITRTLPPGRHTVAARIHDGAWQTFDGPAATFEVTASAPKQMTAFQRANWLLARASFGADRHELAALLLQGEHAFLTSRLAADEAERQVATSAAATTYPRRREEDSVINRGLLGTLLARNGIRERYTHFVSNHFTTWVRKVEGDRKWDEYQRFLALEAAPFPDLLTASSTSATMLLYLDQINSFAKKLNENYARELLELHTVGVHAGYQQSDVTALARLLTGWSAARITSAGSPGPGEVRNYEFRYDPLLNDESEQRIFGIRIEKASQGENRFDRVRHVLEVLAAHPETARFYCRKLAEHYVSLPAPDDLIGDLVSVYHRTGGDSRALLMMLFTHPRFYDAPPRLTHPLQYAMRMFRATGRVDSSSIGGYLRRSRAGLFDCATPDGHPEEDAAYADTNAMIQRWKLSRDLHYGFAEIVPQPIRWAGGEMSAAEKQLVIDIMAVRLTGRVLSEDSNAVALDILNTTKGTRDELIRELGSLMGQLPELNLR